MARINDQIAGLAQFQRDLDQFGSTLEDKHVAPFTRKIALACLIGVVRKTPVDKGTARGGWQVGVGREDRSPAAASKSAAGAISRGRQRLTAVRGLMAVFISNGVKYIGVLENGGFVPTDPGPSKDPRRGRKGRILVKGGYSVQAPRGMVAVTLVEVRSMFP